MNKSKITRTIFLNNKGGSNYAKKVKLIIHKIYKIIWIVGAF